MPFNIDANFLVSSVFLASFSLRHLNKSKIIRLLWILNLYDIGGSICNLCNIIGSAPGKFQLSDSNFKLSFFPC